MSCFVLAYNMPINTPILVLKHGAEMDLTTKTTSSRCNYLMCTTNENILRLHSLEAFRATKSIKRRKTSC